MGKAISTSMEESSVTHFTYLPAGDDSKVHRGLDFLVPSLLKGLTGVANHSTETLDSLDVNDSLATSEVLRKIDGGHGLVIAEPELPVKLLDGFVSSFNDLVDRSKALIGSVSEVESQRQAGTGTFLEHRELDGLGRGIEFHLESLEVAGMSTERSSTSVYGHR